MQAPSIIVIYFVYGLAFFSMGLLVAMEGGHSSDDRVRKALRPLAGFGLVHAVHEWSEMYVAIEMLGGHNIPGTLAALQLCTLSFSFLSLAAFGGYLLAKDEVAQRISLMIPLGLEAVWVFGLVSIKGSYPSDELFTVAQAWTRYSLAIPASILAAAGLIAQQRAFRRAGLVRFGQDAMWAAVAFAWYGIAGQLFTNASALPPSNVINDAVFLRLFGFPVQVLRAILAGVASIYVIRFLRAFQVETERKISDLQGERLKEAEAREALRGELFRRIVAAQEAERQRIARDLHDETGQALTAIGMGLRGLESRMGRDPAQAAETLHQLEALTADSLQELQRLMTDLRPSHLDDLGLPAAIRWYTSKLGERYGLNITTEIHGDEQPLEEAANIALFRIIQEALNNVLKHSQAQHVKIHLSFTNKGVHANIQDDGCGFDMQKIQRIQSSNRPSLGLAGMQERAALLGGAVAVESRPGEGTRVEAFIPYHVEGDGHVEYPVAPR
ncbi:MAG: sensor histidine kinase [Anaerolineae bacterium]